MKKFNATIPLDAIEIASPCHADWNKMQGDDRTRFCGSCQKNVYNLSEMSREEAQNLIAQREGKLCVRFYQREDGTMLTTDCQIGIEISAHIKPRFAPLALAASALMMLVAIGATVAGASPVSTPVETSAEQLRMDDMATPAIMGDFDMAAPPTMGKIAVPSSTPKPAVMGQMPLPRAPLPNPTLKGKIPVTRAIQPSKPTPTSTLKGKTPAPIANSTPTPSRVVMGEMPATRAMSCVVKPVPTPIPKVNPPTPRSRSGRSGGAS